VSLDDHIPWRDQQALEEAEAAYRVEQDIVDYEVNRAWNDRFARQSAEQPAQSWGDRDGLDRRLHSVDGAEDEQRPDPPELPVAL
jgi:hypothetical protein